MIPEDRKALHKNYHDKFYGFPIEDDNELFGRLIMEINQAGLSWETILKKEADRERLMNDAGIIRNRLKINAAIENAKTIITLRKEYGSFKKWIEIHHPKTIEEWVKLFKKTFRFTGGEIVNEFLMSTGYLPGSHNENCPVYKKVLKAKPMWLKR
jgi:DNA-3-methyladenine glycosylase I